MEAAFDINKRWVNQGTGEVIDNVVEESIKTIDQKINEQEAQIRKAKAYDYYKKNILPLPSTLQEEYGNYIHTRYQALLEKLNYDTATAFRFIYLCTFMEYDTGYIIWKNNKVKNKDLIEIFDVTKNTISIIKKKLFENQLIFNDDNGYIYINILYCYRGDIIKDNNYKQQCTRIFNNSIQNLYEKSNDSREHKLIGKFILLLPYINIWHNIICLNPKEKRMERLILPNSEQLDNILHAGDRNGIKRLNELFDITVGGEKTILMITDKKSLKMYAVNPRIYYGGNNINDLTELAGYFKIKGVN